MKIRPLFDQVLVQPIEAEDKTESGILLTAQKKEKPQTATVLAVGPGGKVNGEDVVMQVKVGDVVMYGKYSGNEFTLDGDTVLILRQSEILAIVEK